MGVGDEGDPGLNPMGTVSSVFDILSFILTTTPSLLFGIRFDTFRLLDRGTDAMCKIVGRKKI